MKVQIGKSRLKRGHVVPVSPAAETTVVDSGLKPETRSAAAEGTRCQRGWLRLFQQMGSKVEAPGFLTGILGTINVLRRILDTFGHIQKLSVLVR